MKNKSTNWFDIDEICNAIKRWHEKYPNARKLKLVFSSQLDYGTNWDIIRNKIKRLFHRRTTND